MVLGGLFLSLTRPSTSQQKACISGSSSFNYDPKFLNSPSEQSLAESGFSVNRSRHLLGSGPSTFSLARSALLSWRHFALPWAFVDPGTPVRTGSPFCVCVRELIPLWIMMPLRIAYVRDDASAPHSSSSSSGRLGGRRGSFSFGSGTLCGHLLFQEKWIATLLQVAMLSTFFNSYLHFHVVIQTKWFETPHLQAGEARFSVEWDENDQVWYEIFSFSKPAHLLSFLAYPYVRFRQKIFAQQSGQALVKHITALQSTG